MRSSWLVAGDKNYLKALQGRCKPACLLSNKIRTQKNQDSKAGTKGMYYENY